MTYLLCPGTGDKPLFSFRAGPTVLEWSSSQNLGVCPRCRSMHPLRDYGGMTTHYPNPKRRRKSRGPGRFPLNWQADHLLRIEELQREVAK